MFHLLTSLYTDLTQRPRFNVLFLGAADSGKTTLLQVIKSHYIEHKPLPSRFPSSHPAERHRHSKEETVLPRTRSTVGQNVIDLPAPVPSNRPLVKPIHPEPAHLPGPESSLTPSTWFSAGTSIAPSTSKRPASKALLRIWDLGGDVALRKIWEKYYAETDALVYFWDCESGGNGEARETEWNTFSELARDPRLTSIPFLILLSRCDLIASPQSHSRRTSQAGVTVEAKREGDAHPVASVEVGQDVDLSLSVQDTTQGAFAGGNGDGPSAERAAVEAPMIPKALPPDPLRDKDLVESLRVFVQSNIEAITRRRGEFDGASEAPSSRVGGNGAGNSVRIGEDETGDGSGELADEDRPDAAAAAAAARFPETTVFPLSVLTGRGVEDSMDWIVDKSLAAGRSGRRGGEEER